MYNPHSYAVTIEMMLHCSLGSADEIEKNPLVFLKSFLDKVYDDDATKAKLIDCFDKRYAKYMNTHLRDWSEDDTKQMVHDLREIYSR